jgi:hypothetical protein
VSPGPGQPRAAPSRRHRAPAVTREWPAEEPDTGHASLEWLLVAPVVAGIAVLLAAPFVPDALEPPLHLAIALAIACAGAVVAVDWLLWRRRTAAGRALDGAIEALDRGEDHSRVVERVRRLELRGRSRLCRDTALRCLVEAGRCRRLDRRLRGAAARWLGEARDGVGIVNGD